MHPRHRLDLSPRQLAFALTACTRAGNANAIAARIEARAGPGALVCASVRSGFELLLQSLDLPPGSEIAFSAITHPDLPRIAERHSLVPVPVDLDLATLGPRLDVLEAVAGERTRAVVVAHLFGGRASLEAVAGLTRDREILLVEDWAQGFSGPGDFERPVGDVALFSFGTIKTATALGGAIVLVRDRALLARMRALQARWPAQSRRQHALRVLRAAALVALGDPRIYGAFVRAGSLLGLDVDAVVNRSVRALRPPSAGAADSFGRWLRRRPSAPLLALLEHRLQTFDARRLHARAARGDAAAAALPETLFHPGDETMKRSHWVFPVAAPDPAGLVETLRRAGFDATVATSGMTAVEPPADRPELRPAAAEWLMSRLVFLPVYPELPPAAFERLLDELRRVR